MNAHASDRSARGCSHADDPDQALTPDVRFAAAAPPDHCHGLDAFDGRTRGDRQPTCSAIQTRERDDASDEQRHGVVLAHQLEFDATVLLACGFARGVVRNEGFVFSETLRLHAR